jgi:hypothetical protein
MSVIKQNSVDLFFNEDGDFSFDDISGDVGTTRDLEFRCFQQSIVMRMENGQDEFGIESLFSGTGLLGTYNFTNVFANLEDFHGLRLNNRSIALIKNRVEACLAVDDAFAEVDYRVSVIKKSSDSVEILLMFLFPYKTSSGDIDQFVLQYRGIYSSYNKSFGMFYHFDLSEYGLVSTGGRKGGP